jgi:hypothetical protein
MASGSNAMAPFALEPEALEHGITCIKAHCSRAWLCALELQVLELSCLH